MILLEDDPFLLGPCLLLGAISGKFPGCIIPSHLLLNSILYSFLEPATLSTDPFSWRGFSCALGKLLEMSGRAQLVMPWIQDLFDADRGLPDSVEGSSKHRNSDFGFWWKLNDLCILSEVIGPSLAHLRIYDDWCRIDAASGYGFNLGEYAGFGGSVFWCCWIGSVGESSWKSRQQLWQICLCKYLVINLTTLDMVDFFLGSSLKNSAENWRFFSVFFGFDVFFRIKITGNRMGTDDYRPLDLLI